MQMWWFAQLLYLDVCLKLPIVKQCVAFMVRVWLSPKKEKIKLKHSSPMSTSRAPLHPGESAAAFTAGMLWRKRSAHHQSLGQEAPLRHLVYIQGPREAVLI